MAGNYLSVNEDNGRALQLPPTAVSKVGVQYHSLALIIPNWMSCMRSCFTSRIVEPKFKCMDVLYLFRSYMIFAQ